MGEETLPCETRPVPEAGTVVGAYCEELTRLLDGDSDAMTAIVRSLKAPYFLSTLEIMIQMDDLVREMHSTLAQFAGPEVFLIRAPTIEHLAVAMKLYVISWGTMLDLVARLLNCTFDLGMAERDVRLDVILRNTHVKSSSVLGIVEDYKQTLCIKGLDKLRNDTVHRARIPDHDVEGMLKRRNRIVSSRYSILETNPVTNEEYEKQLSEFRAELCDLVNKKKELWGRLHAQTATMTSRIASALASKTIKMHREGR
jgi:hypothetical protein